MRQIYLCKNWGVEEGEGCLFKGSLLAGDYSPVYTSTLNQFQWCQWNSTMIRRMRKQ